MIGMGLCMLGFGGNSFGGFVGRDILTGIAASERLFVFEYSVGFAVPVLLSLACCCVEARFGIVLDALTGVSRECLLIVMCTSDCSCL